MSVAKLAPVVFQAAKDGHREMLAAVQSGAHVLAENTRAVALRLECEAPENAIARRALQYPEYAEFYKDYTGDLVPGVKVEVCTKSGALGAAAGKPHRSCNARSRGSGCERIGVRRDRATESALCYNG